MVWHQKILILLILLLPPMAFAGEALVNSEVNVDVVGRDGADARAQAMAKAEIEGLTALLERLGPPGQAKDILLTLDAKKVANMVKGTEVLEEKITDNRYRARLRVSFDGNDIEQLVTKVTAPEAKESMPASIGSFLIIPAIEVNGQGLLWEEGNGWRKVWQSVALKNNSGDVVVPFGDNNDASALPYDKIATASYAELSGLAIKYGASDVVLLQAKLSMRPDMVLSVVIRRVNRQDTSVNALTFRADPQETREVLFARAARDIIAQLQDKKSDETASARTVRGGDKNKIMVLASVSTMDSWTELRKKLFDLPMVDRIEMLAVSPRQVDMVLYYRGSEESFTNALLSRKIRLVKNPNYWVISRD